MAIGNEKGYQLKEFPNCGILLRGSLIEWQNLRSIAEYIERLQFAHW